MVKKTIRHHSKEAQFLASKDFSRKDTNINEDEEVCSARSLGQSRVPSCLLTINLRLEIFGGFCITKLKKFESQKNKGFTYLALVSSKSRISVLLVFLLDCLPDYIENYSELNKGSSKAKQIKKVQLKIPKKYIIFTSNQYTLYPVKFGLNGN